MRHVHIGPVLAAALLVVSLTACSAGEGATAAPVPVSPSAAASTSAAPTPSPSSTTPQPATLAKKLAAYSTTPVIEKPVISKAVLAKYGKEKTDKAYAAVVAYLRAESWNMSRLRPKAKYTVADFVSAEKPMSPATRKAWRKELTKAFKGDKDAISETKLVAVWNMGNHGFTFAPTGPYVVDERIGQSVLYLEDETKWLTINLTYSASVRMLKAGVPYRRGVDKTVTMTVYPLGDTFLLGMYEGSWGVDSGGLPE